MKTIIREATGQIDAGELNELKTIGYLQSLEEDQIKEVEDVGVRHGV